MNLFGYLLARKAKADYLMLEQKKLEIKEKELTLKYGKVVSEESYNKLKAENEKLKDEIFKKEH